MMLLAEDFAARAVDRPDAVAVVDPDGSHTTASIWQAAIELADTIGDLVSGPPTVLVQADNTWRTLVTALAVGRLGGFVAVVSGHAPVGELDVALDDVRPDVVVASPECLSSWEIVEKGFPVQVAGLRGWHVVSTAAAAGGVGRWRGGAAAAMTSGSTGRPKCVVQSESALRYAVGCTVDAVGLAPGDHVGAFVPLSSVAAFCFGLYLPAMLGGPMVCLDRWSPAAAVAFSRGLDVRWTMLVPTMALQLALADGSAGALHEMTAMTVGGGPMDAAALGAAEQHLGTRFLRVFGMSECLGHTTSRPTDAADVRLGTDGRPFPGTVVRVVDEAGAVVPDGVVGRAQVTGPSLFLGYAREGAPVPPDTTVDGFFTTGDLARTNGDGSISIMGREKQIIIRGGRNIDIHQVEAAVASTPGVVQVCVVPVPDELLGERAAALVVTRDPALDLESLKRHLELAGVPKHHWPELLFAVKDLPQNRVGKLARNEATAMAQDLAEHLRSTS